MTASHVTFHPLQVGFCRHLEWTADRGGAFKPVEFPAHCALLRHPSRGYLLYDTGYSDVFLQHTRRLPGAIYRAILPVSLPEDQYLGVQLGRFGVSTDDIAWSIISHFHADHVAGLDALRHATFIALQPDVSHIRALRYHPWRAIFKGYLPALLPENFEQRLRIAETSSVVELPTWMRPFERGYDLFDDGSVIGVPMTGHAPGQMGIFIPDADGRPIFLVADACWGLPACRAARLPSWPAMFAVSSRKDFVKTFLQVNELLNREPALTVLPSHCRVSWQGVFDAR